MENLRYRSLIRVFVLSVACCFVPKLQAQAQSAETARARQLFQSAVEHYKSGEFSQALTDFEQAYALKPHPLVEVNIANCFDKLNQAAEALTHFEAFLSSGEGSAAQRDEVRVAIARLSKSAGRLSLRATPAGAQGVIDRQRTAKPLQWLSVGRHRIDVSAEGYEPAVRVVDLQAGETVEVQVDLVPQTRIATPQTPAAEQPPMAAPAAVAVAAQPPTASASPASAEAGAGSGSVRPEASAVPTSNTLTASRSGLPANVWISGGATFGLGVVAVVTGQLALAANREFDTNLAALRNTALTENQRAGAWARGVEAADRADALAAVTDILLGFTFVGVGLTTYFYLADRDASERQRMRVSLSTGSKSGQLQLKGNF